MITIRSYNLFQPSAARTSSRLRQNPAINRWAIFNRPRNADSAEPIFWATPMCFYVLCAYVCCCAGGVLYTLCDSAIIARCVLPYHTEAFAVGSSFRRSTCWLLPVVTKLNQSPEQILPRKATRPLSVRC